MSFRFGRPRRPLDWLRLAAAAIAIATALALVAAGVYVARTIASVSSDPLRDANVRLPGETAATGIAGRLARGERVNVLLLGYGGAGHDGAYLTDSLMLASLDPKSATVTLLSIPRDLWVAIPGGAHSPAFEAKVNEAFAAGAAKGDRDEGIRLADATLERVLGIGIDATVAVDFRAFRTVVDAVGGIDVTVDRPFTALYPRNDDPSIDATWEVISFESGPQHMDGETALRFARARYSDGPEGSDFARSARQQKIMLAAKDEIVRADAVGKVLALVDALRENVRTDLSIADLRALAGSARAYDDARTVRARLDPTNVLESGYTAEMGYVLVPRVADWNETHAYVRRVLDHPASLAEDPAVVIEVSAERAWAGANAARRLGDLGFRARVVVVDDADPASTIVNDGTDGAGAASASFLSDYFGDAPIVDPLGTGEIVVRLGRDWAPPREAAAPSEPVPSPSPSPDAGPRAGASPQASATPARSAGPSATPRP